jgi:hypothetical protein
MDEKEYRKHVDINDAIPIKLFRKRIVYVKYT